MKKDVLKIQTAWIFNTVIQLFFWRSNKGAAQYPTPQTRRVWSTRLTITAQPSRPVAIVGPLVVCCAKYNWLPESARLISSRGAFFFSSKIRFNEWGLYVGGVYEWRDEKRPPHPTNAPPHRLLLSLCFWPSGLDTSLHMLCTQWEALTRIQM